jgi:hypothetical protein
MWIRVDASSTQLGALSGHRVFSVGHIVAHSAGEGLPEETSILVRGEYPVGSEVRLAARNCLGVPGEMSPSLALLILPVATALSVWRTIGLELGEAAAWTAGDPLAPLIGQMALWHGACPAIELAPSHAPELPDVVRIDWSDPEEATRRLVDATSTRPGFAAADLSGRADIIDLFFETMPRWGRLLLAGPHGPRVTIDFYKNLHRKGAVVATGTLEPANAFDRGAGRDIRAQLGRAVQLLGNVSMATRCETLLDLQFTSDLPSSSITPCRVN